MMLDLTPETVVRVKLTDTGLARLRDMYTYLFAAAPDAAPYSPPQADEDGWRELKLSELAQAFGKELFANGNAFHESLQVYVPKEEDEAPATEDTGRPNLIDVLTGNTDPPPPPPEFTRTPIPVPPPPAPNKQSAGTGKRGKGKS
jgi:hypothetical protein